MRTHKGHDVEVVTVIQARCKTPGCKCVMTVRFEGAKRVLEGAPWRKDLGELIWHEVQRAAHHPSCKPCEGDTAKAAEVVDITAHLPPQQEPPTVEAVAMPPDHPVVDDVCDCGHPRSVHVGSQGECGHGDAEGERMCDCDRFLRTTQDDRRLAEGIGMTGIAVEPQQIAIARTEAEARRMARRLPTPEEVDAAYEQATQQHDDELAIEEAVALMESIPKK